MRILHVQKVKGIGGSEVHLLSLLPALIAAGDEVRMVVLAPGRDEARFIDAAGARGIDTTVVPVGRDLDPRPVGAIVAQVRAFGPDLVHTHLIHADLWGQTASAIVRRPSVRTFHNVQRAVTREPARTASRLAGRLAKRTLCISEHVAGFVKENRLAPTDRIRVVPYGIEAASVSHDERARARSSWGIPRGDVVFAMASRLIDGKGHAMAIDAFARAAVALQDGVAAEGGATAAGGDRPALAIGAEEPSALQLLIAGDGPLRQQLERRNRDPRIRFVGGVDDVRSLLAASDVLVFPTEPSLGEGLGLAALEAMAAGVPVIATKVGALPEVVEDGVTGRVVEPEPASVDEAMIELARDPGLRARMGAAGRARATDRFSLGSMVGATREVYREVTGR
jgi:glycosyltransferase involved in cell wall biosynthesis